MKQQPVKPDQSFSKSDRVVRQADFDRVHQGDTFAADKYLVIKGARNALDRSRLGLSISRRVGNAVVRNRWKRVLREAFRLNRQALPGGWDFVARPRKGARLDSGRIATSLVNLCQRIEKQANRKEGRSP